jgi:hypothetical protein
MSCRALDRDGALSLDERTEGLVEAEPGGVDIETFSDPIAFADRFAFGGAAGAFRGCNVSMSPPPTEAGGARP